MRRRPLTLDGVQSVAVDVRKQSGSNTVAVINNVKAANGADHSDAAVGF